MQVNTDAGRPLILVCPTCHSDLVPLDGGGCRCVSCDAVFPKRAAVDVFLSEEEWRHCRARLEEDRTVRERYQSARRHAPLTVSYFDWWVGRMLREVPDHLDGPLVELFCGGAEVCRRMPARFAAAFALDLDFEMVEGAARDLAATGERRVTAVCGTAARLPLPDHCTQVVVVQGALHHARPVLPQVLSEIRRVLRPGGVLVGSEPANDHPLTRAIREWQYRSSLMQGNDPDEEGFSRDGLRTVLGDAGLRLDHYRQFGFIAYPLMGNTDIVPLLAKSRSLRLGGALLALDQALERIPLIRGMAWASLFRAFRDT